jgi:hypothetical protein
MPVRGTVGPILNHVANRRTENWIRRWLKDLDAWKAGTFMPNFHLPPGAIEELTALLEGLDGMSSIP